MKKFDFLSILFGLLLSVIALYFMLRPSTATSASASTIAVIKVGNVSWDQIRTVAEGKMPDLNCFTIESAMSMVAGTARSLGLTVTGESPLKK